MKKVDFRSLIIGLLGGVCIFLMMGQNRGNMGDIVVNSIEVKDDGNGGFIRTYNPSGDKTSYLGTSGSGNGILITYANGETKTTYLGSTTGGGGIFKAFNSLEENVVYLGVSTQESGLLQLKDRYGNPIFEQ